MYGEPLVPERTHPPRAQVKLCWAPIIFDFFCLRPLEEKLAQTQIDVVNPTGWHVQWGDAFGRSPRICVALRRIWL